MKVTGGIPYPLYFTCKSEMVRSSCSLYHRYAPYRPMPSQMNIPDVKTMKESTREAAPMITRNHPSHTAPAISLAAVPPRIDWPRRVFWRMADSMSQTPPPKAGKRSTALAM